MKCVFLLAAVMGVAWARPSEEFQLSTTPDTPTLPTPVLVKDLGNLQILVSQRPQGDYGLEVYEQKGEERHQLTTTVWSLPGDWRPPGLEESEIVHAEILSTGDVVVAFFGVNKGLDLILLPKDLFVHKKTDSGVIVYPKLPNPWHPTRSTPAEEWEWSTTTTEDPVISPEPQRYTG